MNNLHERIEEERCKCCEFLWCVCSRECQPVLSEADAFIEELEHGQ